VIDIAIAGMFCLPLNQREEKPDFLVILSNLYDQKQELNFVGPNNDKLGTYTYYPFPFFFSALCLWKRLWYH